MEERKNKIITELYYNQRFINRLKRISKIDYEDLRSDVIGILLNKPSDYIIDRHEDGILYPTASVIARNLYKKNLAEKKLKISNNQRNKDGKNIDVMEHLVTQDETKDIFYYRSEAFNDAFKDLPFFSRFILDEYLLCRGNAKDVADEQGFNYNYVLKAINTAKRQLQELVEARTKNIELEDSSLVKNNNYQSNNTLNVLNNIEEYETNDAALCKE